MTGAPLMGSGPLTEPAKAVSPKVVGSLEVGRDRGEMERGLLPWPSTDESARRCGALATSHLLPLQQLFLPGGMR